MFEKRKNLTCWGLGGMPGRPEPLRNWGLGVGALSFRSFGSCGSGFLLYLRYAAVPLQSGSPRAKCF